MLDLRTLISQPDSVRKSLKKRGKNSLLPVVETLVSLDTDRRKTLQVVEALKAKRNQASSEIAKLKKENQSADTVLEAMKKIAGEIKILDGQLATIENEIQKQLWELPNLLNDSVPEGLTPAQNVEVRKWGTIPKFSFKPKTHDEMSEISGLLDFKKAGEVTGARFVFTKGLAAQVERSLIQLMLNTHRKAGYEEIAPPFIVNKDSLYGTGTLPKFEEDVFQIEKFGFYLIPTAEVPVTNYHRNEILEDSNLSKRYVAYTPCFRSEAGSYGKDTKGLKRQHQFNKVELVKFVRPEDSEKELEDLLSDAEKILQMLNLPYRVMKLCAGDTSFSSSKTYDIEVWCPGSNAYMEISSCSSFTDFQARRANIRYRNKSGSPQFVHTLNGSGLAAGRTLIAVMENYQKEDGTFEIPEVLRPYLVM